MLRNIVHLPILLLGSIALGLSCSSVKSRSGYRLVKQAIDKHVADSLRKSILSVQNDLFEPGRYQSGKDEALNYRLLRPDTLRPGSTYPLVLVLHGSGAVGMDNISQLGLLAKLWAQPGIRAKYPAFVLVPQFPKRSSDYSLDPDKNMLVSRPDPCLITALALLDSLRKTLPVSERRIYVTGFSMGASSTINALELRPELFAGAIAISGIPAFNRITTLVHIPLWIIHGNADTENTIASDRQFYKEMNALHTRRITFWEIDNYEHNIYPGLYEGETIPRWLFRQERPARER